MYTFDPTEKPLWNVAQNVKVDGIQRHHGVFFTHLGWPHPEKRLIAMNAGASRIDEYYQERRRDPDLPLSPFNEALGIFWLPATLRVVDASKPLPIASMSNSHAPGMPRYIARGPLSFDDGRKLEVRDALTYLGWPHPALGLEPTNCESSEIATYFAANSANPLILTAPWNQYSRGLFLPPLRRGLQAVAPRQEPPVYVAPPAPAGEP